MQRLASLFFRELVSIMFLPLFRLLSQGSTHLQGLSKGHHQLCWRMQVSAEAAQDSAGDEAGEHEVEQNGGTPDELSEPDTSAVAPEGLPDSWETMAEDAGGHESAHESAGGIAGLHEL